MSEAQWIEFDGAEGNQKGYPRKGAEWYDDVAKKWKRCFEHPVGETFHFRAGLKYRRKRLVMPGCPLDTDGDGNCHKHPKGCCHPDYIAP